MTTSSISKQPLKSRNIYMQAIINYCMPVVLPILLAIIPSLYHYSNNVENLILSSLMRMIVFNSVLAIIVYLLFLVFSKFNSFKAANAACVFLVHFNIYGLLYRSLLRWDVIRVEHFTLLPLILVLILYIIFFLSKINDSVLVSFWKHLLLIVVVLVLFNIITIVPAEASRWRSSSLSVSRETQNRGLSVKNSPDIYFIILDEFSGFQAMKEYWKYDGVDEFSDFLTDRGFFIAGASRGSGKDTLREVATRLNYQTYPFETSKTTYFNEIANNQVMSYLESLGYTTVVFDERKLAYPSTHSIHADYVYEYGSPAITQIEEVVNGFYLDEFGELVINNTMFHFVAHKFKKNNPQPNHHRDMIYFTVENINNEQVPSPKFVYVHLLLPHLPFMFDRNGDLLDEAHFTNWNYYIETYIFTIDITEQMIDNILKNSDPTNPPVIIIQSDHGIRNESSYTEGVTFLTDYPEEFKTLILNAMHIPGFDYSTFPQDMDPINNFPLVFYYLFDEEIPLYE